MFSRKGNVCQFLFFKEFLDWNVGKTSFLFFQTHIIKKWWMVFMIPIIPIIRLPQIKCLSMMFFFHPSRLTIPVLNMLLNELLCVSKVPPGVKHVDLDLTTLPPTTAMAVVIYNRWWVRIAMFKDRSSQMYSLCCRSTYLFMCFC